MIKTIQILASVVEEKKNDTDYFAHLKPEHKEVLQEWLRKKLIFDTSR